MDKTTKTILIIAGSLLLLFACAAVVVFATGIWSFNRFVNWSEQNISESPQVAVKVGSEIADFEVPQGFDSPYGVHFGDVTMIGYASQSKNTHILLTQFPEGMDVNVDEMLKQISEYSGDPNRRWYDAQRTLIEEKPIIIRGQETTLSISEGTSSDGISYRSATATFQGRGGPALVLIAGPMEEWDIEMVEAFIASIQ